MELGFGSVDLKQEAAPRERIYFGVILLLILVSFARWLYLPKMAEIRKTQIEVKNNLLQIDTLKQFAQLKIPTSVTNAPEQAVRTGTKFEKALEESSKSQQQVVADVVKLLTSSEILNGISISGMAFAAEINKGTYGFIPATIDLDGKYSGLLGYLGHVERFGRLVTIDNFDLKAKEGSASTVHAKVTAKIYIVHPAGAPTEPVTPPVQK